MKKMFFAVRNVNNKVRNISARSALSRNKMNEMWSPSPKYDNSFRKENTVH